MLTCRRPERGLTAYERYVKECSMVAYFGSTEVRRTFLRQHEDKLGGLSRWLLDLADDQQEHVFRDAARARGGGLPRTVAGLRLAVPRAFIRMVEDPLAVWKEAAHAPPTGVAVDPVCGMLVDPGETPYKIEDGTSELYFCCPHCLALYGDRLLRDA